MSDPVSYSAVLPIGESTAAFVAGLLDTERRRRRTRRGRRALGSFAQAVMVLRWFLDGTRVAQLARDNQVSSSTAYRYLHPQPESHTSAARTRTERSTTAFARGSIGTARASSLSRTHTEFQLDLSWFGSALSRP